MSSCCLSCQTRITAHDALCPACWRQINFIRPPLCDRMGLPMPFDIGGPTLSAAAIADPPDFDRSRGVVCFDGLMRELIHAFKFHDSHNARRLFGRWLVEAGQEIINEADLLVAVPLARGRLISRRFNQAQILAIEVGRRTGKPVRPFAEPRNGASDRLDAGPAQPKCGGRFPGSAQRIACNLWKSHSSD